MSLVHNMLQASQYVMAALMTKSMRAHKINAGTNTNKALSVLCLSLVHGERPSLCS